MADESQCRLILASGSRARRDMLLNAGLSFEVRPADVDEDEIRRHLLAHGDVRPENVAQQLAAAKALAVSALEPGALVIGADQVLAFGSGLVNKACSRAEARATLAGLRGRTHALHSAVVLAKNRAVLWTDVDAAIMTMRTFSDAFLDAYLERAGEDVLHSVGCYQIEGPGIQLFERVAGHHFTILDMPLLSLLAELRRREVIAP